MKNEEGREKRREKTAKVAKDAKTEIDEAVRHDAGIWVQKKKGEKWQPGDLIVKDPVTGELRKSRRAFVVYRGIITGEPTRIESHVGTKGTKRTRKARTDRRPVTANMVWSVVAGDKLAAIEFLGEIGLSPAEAGKQYRMWRDQLWHGVKDQSTWGREG